MVTSVAVGARILEFHFTDKQRDVTLETAKPMAQEVKELRIRIEQVMTLWELLMRPLKSRLPTVIASFRRGVYPARLRSRYDFSERFDLPASGGRH